MVRSPTSDERALSMRRLKIVIVALVGGSAGLIALQGGGSLLAVLVAVVGGLAIGWLLVWYLVQIGP